MNTQKLSIENLEKWLDKQKERKNISQWGADKINVAIDLYKRLNDSTSFDYHFLLYTSENETFERCYVATVYKGLQIEIWDGWDRHLVFRYDYSTLRVDNYDFKDFKKENPEPNNIIKGLNDKSITRWFEYTIKEYQFIVELHNEREERISKSLLKFDELYKEFKSHDLVKSESSNSSFKSRYFWTKHYKIYWSDENTYFRSGHDRVTTQSINDLLKIELMLAVSKIADSQN